MKKMKLYIKLEGDKPPKSIRDFIRYFYRNSDNFRSYAANTYFDKECTKIQSSYSRRSFDDLYLLLKTYYRGITVKKAINLLLTTKITLKGGLDGNPYLSTCNDMGRIRFIYVRSRNYSDSLDEKMSKSKYTWEELLKMINVNISANAIQKYYDENAK